MNKRITSLLLCFVMVFAMLATAVPAFAWSTETATVELSVVADKTEASPGDTITYTVNIGPVKRLQSVGFTLIIPDGLVYGVGKEVDGLKDLLGADKAEYTDSTKTMIIGGGGNYSSEGTTPIMKFTCTVGEGTVGKSLEIEIMDDWEIADNEWETYPNVNINTVPSKITVTAAPKPATGISLNKTATTINKGSTETLIATVDPTDTTDTVTWESSNSTVASVDNTGKVTAKALGTAIITAKAGTKTATCVVKVECPHTRKTPVLAKNSTCKEKGWDAYSKCDDCGQLFDSAGNKIDAIPYRPLENHHMTPVEAKAATCTEKGNKAYYVCSGCSKWFEDATGNVEITNHDSVNTSALGHNYTERITDNAHKKDTASDCRSKDTYWYDCSRCDKNAKDDSAASNKWYESTNAGHHVYDSMHWTDYDTAGHAHKCLYCDAHAEMVNHRPGAAATETTPQTCVDCGYIITPALGHTHHMTPVAAKAATCTEKGNKAYYVCSGCSKWFEDATGNVEITDHNSVVIAASGHDWKAANCTDPKTCKREGCGATEGTALGHKASDKWEKDANHHWHICLNCGEKIVDTEGRHNPDREAPTMNDSVKCRVCGYELMPALEAINVEIPFTVTVKQGGNVAPGKQKFELEIFNIGNSDEEQYNDVTVTAEIETNGKGDYTGKLVIKGSEEQVNAMICEGFYVREKGTKAANWTYSDAVWFVNPGENETGLAYLIFPAERKTSDNGEYYEFDEEHPAEAMTFVNTYTENKTVKPTDPEKPVKPATTEKPTTPENSKSPQTGDSSNMILWIALLFISGGAVAGTTLYSRKRKT